MNRYKVVDRDGVAAVVINKRRVLLLKRWHLPFITHSGMWSFVTGGKNKGERYIDAAYREIMEETAIGKDSLFLLKQEKVRFIDKSKKIVWKNEFFIFKCKNDNVRLSFENKSYRWVTFKELLEKRVVDDEFMDPIGIKRLIESALNGKLS